MHTYIYTYIYKYIYIYTYMYTYVGGNMSHLGPIYNGIVRHDMAVQIHMVWTAWAIWI